MSDSPVKKLFAGIDPGQFGGLGIVDQDGQFVAAYRWDIREPRRLYQILETLSKPKDSTEESRCQVNNRLLKYSGLLVKVYIEDVNVYRKPEAGIELKLGVPGNMLINFGIWQGWLMALDIAYSVIPINTWQAAQKLLFWKKKKSKNPDHHSPLSLAREKWPEASLEFKRDDGKAAGLLLADCARRDHERGIDQTAVRQVRKEKAKKKKTNQKQAQAQSILW
jgi:hypothetical protein